MELATHRIRRQRWRCSTGSPAEAFALRGYLREAQEVAVPAAFERAFDAAICGDEVVHLPRLEVHVRLARVDDLPAALPELLARAVSEQLGRLLAPQPRPQFAPGLGTSIRPHDPAPAMASGTRCFGRESRLAELIEYLNAGTLPWELAQAATAALLEQFRETASEDLAAVVARAPQTPASLQQRVAFFSRLLQLLPAKRWQETAQAIAWHLSSGLPVSQAAALGHALTALAAGAGASSPTLTPDVRKRLAAVMLAVAGHGPVGSPVEGLAEALAEGLGAAPGMALSAALFSLTALAPEAAAFFKPWLEPIDEVASPGTAAQPATAERLSGTPTPGPSSIPLIGGAAAAEAFPVAVRCAGLVLLHPFLPRLFASAGLLRAGEPGLPWSELPRAGALLHWLATGRDEVFEFELGFVKALLGRRPEEPVLVDGGLLTAADREEGEALLQAAVQHWRALKGTTPAGLRASFLQRGGLLREDDAGWRLQVEPAAFDLLLDHLPWGIGVVKLPWMTRPIFTDWPTP